MSPSPMESYTHLANVTGRFLGNPAFVNLPPFLPPQPLPVEPFLLPHLHLNIHDDLQALDCSDQTIKALQAVLEQARLSLLKECQEAFNGAIGKLGRLFGEEESSLLEDYIFAIRSAIKRKYGEDLSLIRNRIVDEVSAAKTRHTSSSSTPLPPSLHDSFAYPLPSPPLEPSGTFTEEVVAILQKAFETSDTLTRAEVKGLIQVTGLNNKQIRTWFANARQRRGRKAAPYDTPRRPTQPSKQSKSRTTNPPLRNVSNSSSSSDSSTSSFSSLVSYASTLETEIPLPEQLNISPIQLERSHSFSQASSTEEEDVPMNLSTLDPPPSHFPRSLSLPSETGPFPKVPPAPSTAETDQFFAIQQDQPSSHHPTLNPASQFFDVQYSQATETATTTESNPNDLRLSFLSQIQETDPFLDDQFLQNVFGTLGVTQGGGLTLSMDSFREEEEVMMRGEGGEGMMVEFAARGGNGEEMTFGW